MKSDNVSKKASIPSERTKESFCKFMTEKLFHQIEFLDCKKEMYKEVFERNSKKYR